MACSLHFEDPTVYGEHCTVLMVGHTSSPSQDICTIVKKRRMKLRENYKKHMMCNYMEDRYTFMPHLRFPKL